jgi:hypothetical protein
MGEINFVKNNLKSTKKPAAKTDGNIGWSKPSISGQENKDILPKNDTTPVAANLKANQPFRINVKKNNSFLSTLKNLFGINSGLSASAGAASIDRKIPSAANIKPLPDKNIALSRSGKPYIAQPNENAINYRQELKNEIEKRIGQKGANTYQAKEKDTPILHLSVKPGIFDMISGLFGAKENPRGERLIQNKFNPNPASNISKSMPAPANNPIPKGDEAKKPALNSPDLLSSSISIPGPGLDTKPQASNKKWENPKIIETNLLSDKLNLYNYKGEIITAILFVLLSCILVASLYGLLFYWQKNKLAKIEAEEQKMKTILNDIKVAKERVAKADNFNSKLKPVIEILNGHIYWTNWFAFLERNSLKDLKISNFVKDVSGNYQLNSTVKKYGQIGEVLTAFRQNGSVLKAEANAGQMKKNEIDHTSEVSFVLDLVVDQSLFLKPTLD